MASHLPPAYPRAEATCAGKERGSRLAIPIHHGRAPRRGHRNAAWSKAASQEEARSVNSRIWLGGLIRVVAIVALTAVMAVGARAEDTAGQARAVLKAMSDYMAGQKTIQFTFDSSIEVITPEIQKIQYTSSGRAFVERPNKLRVSRVGGTGELDLFFDGKTATLYGPGIKTYAQLSGADSIDQLIDALENKYGFAGPGADLLLSNVYDALMANVIDAKYLGTGVIGGMVCDHVAFRTRETDWQLWVEIGPNAIPRKFVITSKAVAAAPEYSVVVTGWKTDVKIDPSTFVFTPPPDAKKGTVSDLAGLDEYPHSAAPGGSQ
jgi:hypothetical protein